MSEQVVTGIEVTCAMPDSTKAVGDLLHKLHLDRLGQAAISITHLLVTLDAVEYEFPVTGTHLIQCAPGEHEFSCAFLGWGVLARQKAEWYERATLRVPVLPGQIVTLRYMHNNFDNFNPVPGANQNAHIEVLGVRQG
jgi:hypothetical protein